MTENGHQITAAEYEALPADFSRTIEVVDGHIVKCESPSRLHNRVARRLASSLESGRKPEPCLMVETDVDVRLSDVPLSLRRPDVTVYHCLEDDERLYAGDAVLVVEIVSPDSSFRTDTVEKKAVCGGGYSGVSDRVPKRVRRWNLPDRGIPPVRRPLSPGLPAHAPSHHGRPGAGRCFVRRADRRIVAVRGRSTSQLTKGGARR
ncbi:Uma2 family endonuclease [Nocardia cyriacigeorgica]|nr:Uma2 family endonuclease [Nocardia cyriacigeorgica]